MYLKTTVIGPQIISQCRTYPRKDKISQLVVFLIASVFWNHGAWCLRWRHSLTPQSVVRRGDATTDARRRLSTRHSTLRSIFSSPFSKRQQAGSYRIHPIYTKLTMRLALALRFSLLQFQLRELRRNESLWMWWRWWRRCWWCEFVTARCWCCCCCSCCDGLH